MVEPADGPEQGPTHPYGDFTRMSADGKYWFEWTPFTPAIRAWRNAERNLRTAHDRLVDANVIYGFAIPGLEPKFHQFKRALKVLTEHVEEAIGEARTVVQVLDAANVSYANANDASRAEYQRVMAVVDGGLAAQRKLGRR
jgi:hypothetical protein